MRFTAIILISFGLLSQHSAMAESIDERTARIKAAYVVRLASYFTWSADPVAGSIELCVDNAPLISAALQNIAGIRVKGKEIRVRRITHGNLDQCHVLYASGTQEQINEVLKSANSLPVLTITDEDNADDNTGLVHLFRHHNTIRFLVDETRANHRGILVDDRLLRLSSKSMD